MALRLPVPPASPGHGPAAGPGPVVVFLPAHDEEATVAAVVARVPELVLGRRVECLVVDDGSGDRTAELAAAAGATVLSSAANRGLGAAVRTGLTAATERGAAAVAFCDADREYDPAELERLVAPILEGRADYVVGSRFAGHIGSMLPQRRLGNQALTATLRFVARAPIGDGQSGFRALSRAAAADAEIVHDYNYAQVLTLDLLAKGYRYLEVPISYRFRTRGRSFVRPWPYLCRVVPSVWRELNRHHRAREAPPAHPIPRQVPGPGRVAPGPAAAGSPGGGA
jgi:glycosyltransferase involved in cell wall biosynthesis